MGTESESRAVPPGPGAFATTHWSVVLAAGDGSPQSMAALEKLCQAYWYPIYAHVRRRVFRPEDAQDMTQEFFASLLRHESLATIRREKGRFRTFLLTSLNYFLSDQADKALAAKRGSGKRFIELDAMSAEERYACEPMTEESPAKAFDRRWAAALVERSIERLKTENDALGKAAQFEALKVFLARETISGEYETLAPSLGLSANTIAAAVRRMRLRFREIAMSEAMQTVATPVEAEAELKALWA